MTKQDVQMNLWVWGTSGTKMVEVMHGEVASRKVLNFLSKNMQWWWKNKLIWFFWLPASLTGEQSVQKEFELDYESREASSGMAFYAEYGKIELALFGTQNTGAKWHVGFSKILQVLQWTPVCLLSSTRNMPGEQKQQFHNHCSVALVLKECQKLEIKRIISSSPPLKGCLLCYVWW